MGAEITTYYSYLLRMWPVVTDSEHTWRIQLENVQSGEKHGFTSLEDLLVFLCQVTTNKKDDPLGRSVVHG